MGITRRGFFGRVLGGFAAAIAAPLLKPVPAPEAIYWPGADGLYLFVSDTQEFEFGFSGFKESDDIDGIVGTMTMRVPMRHPRLHRTLYNIQGD